MENATIQMKNIVKIYPPDIVAVDQASIEVNRGEIYSIIGENGAGKSTLMKVLFGLEKSTEGEVLINGRQVEINSPKEAVANGIGMVHQEFMLIGEYTVLENIVLGNEPKRLGLFLNLNAARHKLESIMRDFRFDIPLDAKVRDVSIAAQQKIEIIKLLYREVDTLILDEPTAVLAPQEVEELFNILREIRAKGKSILFISHKLNEVLEISDRITVMRAGHVVETTRNENLTKEDLARAMVGREVVLTVEKGPIERGDVVLAVEDMTVMNGKTGKADLDHVSMEVHAKEIVGIAGVEGNGQYELTQAILGLAPATGTLTVEGRDLSAQPVRERRRLMAYVPQDRKVSGSSQTDAIETNTLMTHHYVDGGLLGPLNMLKNAKIRELADRIIQNYQVVCKSARSPISSLSGGNQQKVIVGREFELDCPVLVVDQPVRGLDVGSIEYIHKKIIEKRDNGAACLLISADLDELFSLSDRILVMHKGRIVAAKLAGETTREEVGEYMLGVKSS